MSVALAAIPHALVHVAGRVAPDAVAVRLSGAPFAVKVGFGVRVTRRRLSSAVLDSSLFILHIIFKICKFI